MTLRPTRDPSVHVFEIEYFAVLGFITSYKFRFSEIFFIFLVSVTIPLQLFLVQRIGEVWSLSMGAISLLALLRARR